MTVLGNTYTLKRSGSKAVAEKNGKPLFTFEDGARVITDTEGNIISKFNA